MDFKLTNDPPKRRPWQGQEPERRHQRMLLDGLDCLPGQKDLLEEPPGPEETPDHTEEHGPGWLELPRKIIDGADCKVVYQGRTWLVYHGLTPRQAENFARSLKVYLDLRTAKPPGSRLIATWGADFASTALLLEDEPPTELSGGSYPSV